MINRKEYAFEDIQIFLFGRLVEGVTAIEYEESKSQPNIHGRGNKPVAYGRGKVDFTGKLTLLQSEVEAILASIPNNKGLVSLPAFNITVAYAPLDDPSNVITDQLESCRVERVKKGMSTDDNNMSVELDLAIFNIKYNV